MNGRTCEFVKRAHAHTHLHSLTNTHTHSLSSTISSSSSPLPQSIHSHTHSRSRSHTLTVRMMTKFGLGLALSSSPGSSCSARVCNGVPQRARRRSSAHEASRPLLVTIIFPPCLLVACLFLVLSLSFRHLCFFFETQMQR